MNEYGTVERCMSEHCTTESNQSLGSTIESGHSFELELHKSQLAPQKIALAQHNFRLERHKCPRRELPTVMKNPLPMAPTESSEQGQ